MESLANTRSAYLVRDDAASALRHILMCSYCRQTGSIDVGPDGRPWSIDHVIPRNAGGSDRMENLVKSCHRCNSRKHTKIGGEWQPNDDVMTAAGVLYGSLNPDQYGRDFSLDAVPMQVANLQAELNYIKMMLKNERQKVKDLERYVWEVSKVLGDISLLAKHGKPSFDISYNRSEDGDS